VSQNPIELTKPEWSIMKVLWEKGPSAARNVEAELKNTRNWAYSTVNTMLRRLETKGVLATDQIGKVTFYRPVITEKKAKRSAVKQLCEKLFGGSTEPLMKFLLENEKVSEQHFREIQELIDERRSK